MIKKNMLKIVLLWIYLPCFSQSALRAQPRWINVPFVAHGQPVGTLMAAGIRAKADIDGKNVDSFILLYGRRKSAYCDFGVLVGRSNDIITRHEFDEFHGPDLSQKAMNKNFIKIGFVKNGHCISFNTRMIIEDAILIPKEFRGTADEFFATNIDPKNKIKWIKFVNEMREGFDYGYIEIKNGSNNKKIKIVFNFDGFPGIGNDVINFVN